MSDPNPRPAATTVLVVEADPNVEGDGCRFTVRLPFRQTTGLEASG
jgi:hypothetical protein